MHKSLSLNQEFMNTALGSRSNYNSSHSEQSAAFEGGDKSIHDS